MFDCTTGFMVVTVFFLMFQYLTVKFVSKHVDGAIHILVGAGSVQIVAWNMQRGFNLLGKLFNRHGDFDINHVIEVIADAGELG